MSENIHTPTAETPEFNVIVHKMSIEEFLVMKKAEDNGMQAQQPQPQPQQQFQQAPQQQAQFQSAPQYDPQLLSQFYQYARNVEEQPSVIKNDAPEARQPMSRRARKLVGFALAGVVLVGGAGTGYALNVADVQSVVSLGGSHTDQENGLAITPIQSLDESSLSPDQCKDPSAYLMVAKVSGNFPLAPIYTTTEKPTPTIAAPYMTDDMEKKLPKSQQAEFHKYITHSHYPEATLNNLPLAGTVCTIDGINGAISHPDGVLTIDRSKLAVHFRDINELFDLNAITIKAQTVGAYKTPVDPSKNEFMTMPNIKKSMFLRLGSDAVYNKSVTDMIASVNDQKQLQVILSTMESEAVQQLVSVVDGQKNIEYPSGAKTLEDVIDASLLKRLGKTSKRLDIFGSYSVKVDVPTDSATKNPVTDNDKTTGASPLKFLDPAQKFTITNIDVEYGGLTAPKPTEQPSASPTVTPPATPAP